MVVAPRITHVAPSGRNAAAMQWTHDTPADPSQLRFRVQRSVTGLGDWADVAAEVLDPFYVEVFDAENGPHILASTRSIVYRVGAYETGDPSQVAWSVPVDIHGSAVPTLETPQPHGIIDDNSAQYGGSYTDPWVATPGRRRPIALVAGIRSRRRHLLVERFMGVPVALLKRRRFGLRCPRCWSPEGRTALHGKCPQCWGTGWDGGYHTAVIVSAKINETPAQDTPEPGGAVIERQARVSLPAFPLVERDDVLVNLDTSERWRIESNDERVLHNVRFKQRSVISLISRARLEYSIPVDLGQAYTFRVEEP